MDSLKTLLLNPTPSTSTLRRLLVPAPDAARDIHGWLDAETPAWEDMARAGDMAQPYRDAFTAAARGLRTRPRCAPIMIKPDPWVPRNPCRCSSGGKRSVTCKAAWLLARRACSRTASRPSASMGYQIARQQDG